MTALAQDAGDLSRSSPASPRSPTRSRPPRRAPTTPTSELDRCRRAAGRGRGHRQRPRRAAREPAGTRGGGPGRAASACRTRRTRCRRPSRPARSSCSRAATAATSTPSCPPATSRRPSTGASCSTRSTSPTARRIEQVRATQGAVLTQQEVLQRETDRLEQPEGRAGGGPRAGPPDPRVPGDGRGQRPREGRPSSPTRRRTSSRSRRRSSRSSPPARPRRPRSRRRRSAPRPPAATSGRPCGTVTSEYGRRWGRMHEGLDIDDNRGSAIVAAKAGVGDLRRVVQRVRQHDPDRPRRRRGDRLRPPGVHQRSREGQRVSQGQFIGVIGTTGHSTGHPPALRDARQRFGPEPAPLPAREAAEVALAALSLADHLADPARRGPGDLPARHRHRRWGSCWARGCSSAAPRSGAWATPTSPTSPSRSSSCSDGSPSGRSSGRGCSTCSPTSTSSRDDPARGRSPSGRAG